MKNGERIAVASIKVLWSESADLVDGQTFASFSAFDAAMRPIAEGMPGYCKVGFLVEWADGEQYEGKLCMESENARASSILAAHMLGFLECSTMRRRVPGWTEEQQRASWVERIGNAVPVGTAQAIAEQILLTLLSSDVGAGLLPSGGAVWVQPGFGREVLHG